MEAVGAWKDYKRAGFDRQIRDSFKELGVNQSGDKAWQLYENNLSNSYFIIDGTIDVLEKLKNKYRLFIVSNGTASVQDKRIAVLIFQNILKIFLFLRELDITSLK